MSNAWRKLKYLVVLFPILLLFFFFGPAGRPDAASDIVVTDIEFKVFPQPGSLPLGERQAILGDKIRIWAVLTSRNADARDFPVAFSYLEENTKETAQIGKVTVSEIPQGQIRRVPLSWDTSELIPGKYSVSVVADPEGVTGDPNTCNNRIPRDTCDSEPAKRGDQYSIVILKSGLAISPPDVSRSIPPCPTGQLTQLVAALFMNLGTAPITSMDMTGYFRLSTAGDWRSLDYVEVKLAPSAQNPVQPGANGTIGALLDYEKFSRDFTNRGLGQRNELQLKLEVTAEAVKVEEILVPESREATLKVYPSVDKWTFPRRTGCAWAAFPGEVEPQGGEQVKVAPGLSPSGETIYHVLVQNGKSALVSLSTDLGRQLWRYEGFAGEVGSPVVGKDPDGNEVIYLSSSEGYVYAVTAKDTQGELRWKGPAQKIGTYLTKPVVLLDGQGRSKAIYVGSETGLYALDPDGKLKWSYTQDGTTLIRITQPPLLVTKGTTTTIWFASSGDIYKLGEDGKKLDSRRFSANPISTPLKLLDLGGKNYIYFGDENGAVSPVDEANFVRIGSPITLAIEKVTGIRVTKQGRNRHVLFVTLADGTIVKLEFSGSQLTEQARAAFTREIESELDVFTDSAGEAVAVLVSSIKGELRAISPDLTKVLQVKIWGEDKPFSFETKDKRMTSPIVDPLNKMVLVGSEDGFLYAFDLSQFK